MMENISIKETVFGDYKVNFCIDPYDGQTIVWYAGHGDVGPIIKGKPEEVKEKFLEVMRLAESIRKLMYFKINDKFPNP